MCCMCVWGCKSGGGGCGWVARRRGGGGGGARGGGAVCTAPSGSSWPGPPPCRRPRRTHSHLTPAPPCRLSLPTAALSAPLAPSHQPAAHHTPHPTTTTRRLQPTTPRPPHAPAHRTTRHPSCSPRPSPPSPHASRLPRDTSPAWGRLRPAPCWTPRTPASCGPPVLACWGVCVGLCVCVCVCWCVCICCGNVVTAASHDRQRRTRYGMQQQPTAHGAACR